VEEDKGSVLVRPPMNDERRTARYERFEIDYSCGCSGSIECLSRHFKGTEQKGRAHPLHDEHCFGPHHAVQGQRRCIEIRHNIAIVGHTVACDDGECIQKDREI